VLIVDKHCSDVCCDEFAVPQIDHNSKQVKNSKMKILFAISMGETCYFKHRKYQNLWMNNKSIEMQFVCIFFHIC